ncbi:MAG: glycosyltransferase [Desulfovibrionaceae bacterium]|nr:glycosyltransferase [Desulfovibrionaceae bacterium]
MLWLWFIAACVQCGMLWFLWHSGKQRLNAAPVGAELAGHTPLAGLIIPVAGQHPNMPQALRSLLMQDYPSCLPVMVTATAEEPAALLIAQLQQEFPALRHVVAGTAKGCGQKNHNTLCAIAALAAEPVEVYVFCDSTHRAKAYFVRSLVQPIAAGRVNVTTGYHMVVAEDEGIVTRAYQLCVLLMRLLQAVAVFTQPWGGAMAIKRSTFESLHIKALWAGNVVDDCSLAALLLHKKEPVLLCPQALLHTVASQHRWSVWGAWMDRQILFLKFCVPSQWLLLGLFAAIMSLTPLTALYSLPAALFGLHCAVPWWLGLLYCAVLAAVVARWREFLPEGCRLGSWLAAFAAACAQFVLVFVRTALARGIVWHGIDYTVGRGGAVRAMRRIY